MCTDLVRMGGGRERWIGEGGTDGRRDGQTDGGRDGQREEEREVMYFGI